MFWNHVSTRSMVTYLENPLISFFETWYFPYFSIIVLKILSRLAMILWNLYVNCLQVLCTWWQCQFVVFFDTNMLWFVYQHHDLRVASFCLNLYFLDIQVFLLNIVRFNTEIIVLFWYTSLGVFRLSCLHTSSRNYPLARFGPIRIDAMCDDVLEWSFAIHV